jgi:hypothetical protein
LRKNLEGIDKWENQNELKRRRSKEIEQMHVDYEKLKESIIEKTGINAPVVIVQNRASNDVNPVREFQMKYVEDTFKKKLRES